jgi:outer membrane protein assembly factor BamB
MSMRCKLAFFLAASLLQWGCTRAWPNYRYSTNRTGQQPWASALSNPSSVEGHLAVGWLWPSSGSEGGSFKSSPIVFNHKVFIGSSSGYFYALDANTGSKLWQYPPTGSLALLGSCSIGQYGIQSSASRARINGKDAVVFGAPDPDTSAQSDYGLGSARLWALDMSGNLIWKSDVVAHISGPTPGSGCNFGSLTELHERIAYSSPLISGGIAYVGIHDWGDDPIQNGKVVAVDLSTGRLVPGFSYVSTCATSNCQPTPGSTRGGGVWNAPATDGSGVYFTTGNTRTWNGGSQPVEPSVNNGLSLVRVDPTTGAVTWKFQPVPYPLDDDPDWSAGVAVMYASCGEVVTSVQKDGWAYVVNANNGSCKWQYPPTGNAPPSCVFPPNGPHLHGDTDYKRPGAVWGDVEIINAGGWGLVSPLVSPCPPAGTGPACTAGYARLHALNACGPDSQRVRWILDVPHATPGYGYAIGAPTVTGGITYVTTDQGHVVAIADTSLRQPVGYQCTNEFINPSLGPLWNILCTLFHYQLVPTPKVIADVALPDGSDAAGLRNEAAITRGKLYVGTSGGHVYALWPK